MTSLVNNCEKTLYHKSVCLHTVAKQSAADPCSTACDAFLITLVVPSSIVSRNGGEVAHVRAIESACAITADLLNPQAGSSR